MSYLSCVQEFHEKFQQPYSTSPALEHWPLRCRLLAEEKDEFLDALAQDDRVGMLDALCDLKYVFSGAILMLGLTEHYLQHSGGRDGAEIPTGLYSETDAKYSVRGRVALLSRKINYLASLCEGGSVNGAVANLHDQQGILNGLVIACGFSPIFSDAFALVHANNMAKLWDGRWRDNVSGLTFTEASWKPGWYIAKDDGGKVRKPMSHKKVDLTRLVAAL